MLEGASSHLLIQFQTNHKFKGGVFENFVEQERVSSSDPQHTFDFRYESCCICCCHFMIVRSVTSALLPGIVEREASIQILWVLNESNILVCGFDDFQLLVTGEFPIDIADIAIVVFVIKHLIQVAVSLVCNFALVGCWVFQTQVLLSCRVNSFIQCSQHGLVVSQNCIPFMLRNVVWLISVWSKHASTQSPQSVTLTLHEVNNTIARKLAVFPSDK
mmetsp:Transcript_28747/g.60092  ORF Transcript_28747/g.60092 Transcript_28747/m.60092 type:complete len:217 (-) Transcript_28747:200-850(-)